MPARELFNRTFFRNTVSFLVVLLASFLVLVVGEYVRTQQMSQEATLIESYSGCITSEGSPC